MQYRPEYAGQVQQPRSPQNGAQNPEMRPNMSQNTSENVQVPTSEHVAEIVGRQGEKSVLVSDASAFTVLLSFIGALFCI